MSNAVEATEAPAGAAAGAGPLIRYWRKARGLSQMALALDVGISPRHMSFVETGRSRPGRDVLVRIAERLGVPPAEENALLEAAGHARRHRRSELTSPGAAQVRRVLRFVLDRMEPNGAIVFDDAWNIVMANEAHLRGRDLFLGGRELPEAVSSNLLRLTFHPLALRPCIVNWNEVAAVTLDRVERELEESPSNRALADTLDEVRGYGPVPTPSRASTTTAHAGVLLPVHLRRDGIDVRFFSVISSLGSAIDVGIQALRIETFFPADSESEAALRNSLGAGWD